MSDLADRLDVRPMRLDELAEMRAVSVEAFGGDESIGVLLDALRRSWPWHDELCFVAVLDGAIVGQVLYTSALLDAPHRLVDVLVLSPIGVRPELEGRGVGGHLIRSSLGVLRARSEPVVLLEGHPGYYPDSGSDPAVSWASASRPSASPTPRPWRCRCRPTSPG